MTYEELEINAEIGLREKPHEESRLYKTIRYRVIAKYPSMCMVEDQNGKRRGVAVGELIMNHVITQEPYFEFMRQAACSEKKIDGWRRRNAIRTANAAEYTP